MLTGFKRQVQEACQRNLEKRRKEEESRPEQEQLPSNAIVFTFTQPMRARVPFSHPSTQPNPVHQLVTIELKYESWEQEAFSRFFRRNSSRLDMVVREVHAAFACDWFYIESLYTILRKHNMMPRTTLPLLTCQYPVLEVTLPEVPWGFYFPYFDTQMFDNGFLLYRLSPRFQLMLQSYQ